MTQTEEPTPALLQLLGELERYAGWLGSGTRQSRLRASVTQLAAAVTDRTVTSDALSSVQTDIDGVRSSAIAPLLRKTMRKLRSELGDLPSDEIARAQ